MKLDHTGAVVRGMVRSFLGYQTCQPSFLMVFTFKNDGSGNVDVFYTADDLGLIILILNSQGQLQQHNWDDEKRQWQVMGTTKKSDCDVYAICAAFAISNSQSSPICSCLKGFEPKNQQEWIQQNWTGGCVRRTPFSCETANKQNKSVDSTKQDGFLKLQTVKVPDFAEASSITQDQRNSQCLENCSCVAYSYDATIGSQTSEEDTSGSIIEELSEAKLQELLLFKFEKLATATNNFSSSNKLGQGGFGPVYKGELQNDEELNPKISDFGMARIFGGREDQANTQRVVGTYGYMSPEYAMQGVSSEKSDVFGFGVLLLEIISGRRNSSFYDSENAWLQWCEDNIVTLIDSGIYDTNLHESILRCIHIGLLCIQEFAADRPTMATVISMLNSEITNLLPPRQPAFIMRQNMLNSVSSDQSLRLYSINTVSITDIHGR
ncbi:hypothetical protein RJT34_15962 [Clitoria ternatea]|uniref:Protein kinase domain-containing protein n=1 Tax=Clitoria ternatea TaxID=43366 RepID=A0AAN9J7V4_CLITE